MLAKVISCAIVGLDAELVEVEVDVVKGYPAFALVGLLSWTAITMSALYFPAPARKQKPDRHQPIGSPMVVRD